MNLSRLNLATVATCTVGPDYLTITDSLIETPIPNLNQITLTSIPDHTTEAWRIGSGRIWDVYEGELWHPVPSTVRKAVNARKKVASDDRERQIYDDNRGDESESTADGDISCSSSEPDSLTLTPTTTEHRPLSKVAVKICCPRLAASSEDAVDSETTIALAIEREAALYCGPLMGIQGHQVPRFHGLFKAQVDLKGLGLSIGSVVDREGATIAKTDVYIMLLDRAGDALCDAENMRYLSGDLRSVSCYTIPMQTHALADARLPRPTRCCTLWEWFMGTLRHAISGGASHHDPSIEMLVT